MDDEILKPEESYGGFDPASEEGKSTFMLDESDAYPGKLPYTVEEPEPDIPVDPEPVELPNLTVDVPMEPVDEAGETWDLFEDESSIPSQDDVIREAEESQARDAERLGELIKAEEEESIPEPSNLEFTDDEQDPSSRVSYELEQKPPKGTSSSESRKAVEIQDDFVPQLADDQVVELDDELKAMLEADLEKSKERKPSSPKEEVPEFDEQKNQEGLDSFRSVEDLAVADVIDISAIDAEHPSTFLMEEEEKKKKEEEQKTKVPVEQSLPIQEEAVPTTLENEADLKKAQKKEKKPKKEKEAKPPKEKMPRKPIPIIPILSWAGGIILPLLLALGAVYYFYSLKLPKLHNTIFKLEKSEEQKIAKEKPKDTLVVKKEVPKDTVKQESKEELKKEEPKEIRTPAKVTEKPIVKKEVKTAKEKPVVKIKPEKKQVQPKPEPKKPVKDEIYQIEIYSTPSQEDAEIWMNKLKKRDINATLQLQKVRGVTVYKIRYGYFKSAKEAQETAIKLGFSRSWIDRIK